MAVPETKEISGWLEREHRELWDTDLAPGDRMKQVSLGKQSDGSASLTRKAATPPPQRLWVGLWVLHLVPVLNKSIPAHVPPVHSYMRFLP